MFDQDQYNKVLKCKGMGVGGGGGGGHAFSSGKF